MKESTIGNMIPLLRLPLCGIAITWPPVFSSYLFIHFQRSRGLSLPCGLSVVYGRTMLAL